MLKGVVLLGIGIILVIFGICLTAGVIALQIPLLGWVTWIPVSIGGFLVLIGIILMIFKR